MTTGCCEPRQAGSQDTRVETERRRGPYQRLVVRSHRPARRTQAPPCTTGQGKNRAAPVSRQRPADREPPRTRRHRRTGQRTGRPPRGPGHPHDRTREKDLSVSTYISSPCPTPPRIRPPAPPLLVFPHPAALWRPPDSRRTTPPRPATPPRIPFSASPSRIRAFCASDSRRGRRHSRRTKRPLRQTPRLSFQPGW